MAARLTEEAFQSQVLDLARLTGWKAMHVHDSRREVSRGNVRVLIGDRDAKGWPDLVLVRHRLIVRELKVGRNRLTQEQAEWIERLLRAGVDAAVWRPADWPLIRKTLTERT